MSDVALNEANKALVIEAITRVFVERDVTAPEKLFHPDYRQHNPSFSDGNVALTGLISSLSDGFKYEMGMVVAEGDLVMVHGRFVGWGPKPMVGVDIFRVRDGKLVEHWDVLQEEVPASQTVSGHEMFEGGS